MQNKRQTYTNDRGGKQGSSSGGNAVQNFVNNVVNAVKGTVYGSNYGGASTQNNGSGKNVYGSNYGGNGYKQPTGWKTDISDQLRRQKEKKQKQLDTQNVYTNQSSLEDRDAPHYNWNISQKEMEELQKQSPDVAQQLKTAQEISDEAVSASVDRGTKMMLDDAVKKGITIQDVTQTNPETGETSFIDFNALLDPKYKQREAIKEQIKASKDEQTARDFTNKLNGVEKEIKDLEDKVKFQDGLYGQYAYSRAVEDNNTEAIRNMYHKYGTYDSTAEGWVVDRGRNIIKSNIDIASGIASTAEIIKDLSGEAYAKKLIDDANKMRSEDHISDEEYNDALEYAKSFSDYDANDPTNFGTQMREASSVIASDIANGEDGIGKFIGTALDSSYSSLSRILMFGSAGSLAVMGAESATQKYFQNLERGYTQEQSFMNALATGAIEVVTELGTVDRFVDTISGVKGQGLFGQFLNAMAEGRGLCGVVAQDVFRQGVSEFGEELVGGNLEYGLDVMTAKMYNGEPVEYDSGDIFYASMVGLFSGMVSATGAYVGGGYNIAVQTKEQYDNLKNDVNALVNIRNQAMQNGEDVTEVNKMINVGTEALNAFETKSKVAKGVDIVGENVDPNLNDEQIREELKEALTPIVGDAVDVNMKKDALTRSIMKTSQDFLNMKGVNMEVDQFVAMDKEKRQHLLDEASKIQSAIRNADIGYATEILNDKGENIMANKNAYVIKYVNGRPTIIVNPEGETSVIVSAIHEALHTLEGTEAYNDIYNTVFSEKGSDLKKINELLVDRYKGVDLAQVGKEALVVAISEDMMGDEGGQAFIDHMAKYNTDVAYRLWYQFKDIMGLFQDNTELGKITNKLTYALANQERVYMPDGTEFSTSHDYKKQTAQKLDDMANGIATDKNQAIPLTKVYRDENNKLYVQYTPWQKKLGWYSKTNSEIPNLVRLGGISNNLYDDNDPSTNVFRDSSHQGDKNPIDRKILENLDVFYWEPFGIFESQSPTATAPYIAVLKATDNQGFPIIMSINKPLVTNRDANGNAVDYLEVDFVDYNGDAQKHKANMVTSFYGKNGGNNNLDVKKWLNDNNYKMLWGNKGAKDTAVLSAIGEMQKKAQAKTGDKTTVDDSIVPLMNKATQVDLLENADMAGDLLINDEDIANWKRGVEVNSILTYDEAENSPKTKKTADDFGTADIAKALQDGVVTVYSSMPIKDGAFVSPSKSLVNSYIQEKGGKLHKAIVYTDNVAWSDTLEGRYAPVQTEIDTHLTNDFNNDNLKLEGSYAMVAPFRKEELTFENMENLEEKAKPFVDYAHKLAGDLGVNITNITPNIGAYEGGAELSYTFDLDTNDRELADTFAYLLGDLGLETQKAVIAQDYVIEDDDDANAIEISIDFKDTAEMMSVLKEVGVNDYTIPKNQKTAIITYGTYDFNDSFDELAEFVALAMVELQERMGDNYVGAEKNTLNQRYAEPETRRGFYQARINATEAGQEGRNQGNSKDAYLQRGLDALNTAFFSEETSENAEEENTNEPTGSFSDEDGNVIEYSAGGKNGLSALLASDEEKLRKRGEELQNNLKKAVELYNDGKDMDNIWFETGWVRKADGKWRFQFYDGAEDTLKKIGDFAKNAVAPASYSIMDFIDEDNVLFEMYPSLKNITIWFDDHGEKGTRGSYEPSTNTINMNLERFIVPDSPTDFRVTEDGRYKTGHDFAFTEKDIIDLSKTFFHELQHAIQKLEGFEGGSNSTIARFEEHQDAIKNAIKEQNDVAKLLRKEYGINNIAYAVDEFSKYLINKYEGRKIRYDKRFDFANDQRLANLLGRYEQAKEIRFSPLQSISLNDKQVFKRYYDNLGEVEAREEADNTLDELDRTIPPYTEGALISDVAKAELGLEYSNRRSDTQNVGTDEELAEYAEGLRKNQKAVDRYGAFDYGMNNARETDIAKKTSKGDTMKGVRTLANSAHIDDDFAERLQSRTGLGEFAKETQTDEKVLDEAYKYVQGKGFTKAYESVMKSDSLKTGYRDLAVMTLLMDEMYARGLEKTPEYEALADRWLEKSHAFGLGLRGVSYIKRMSPQGQIITMESEMARVQAELEQRWGDRAPNLVIPEELRREYLSDDTSDRRRAEIREEIAQMIADKIPPTWKEQLNSFRRLAMLFNPRTWIKNKASNTVFGYINEGTRMIRSVLETVAKNYGDTHENSIFHGMEREAGTYNPFSAVDKERYDRFVKDYDENFEENISKYADMDIGTMLASTEFGRLVESKRKSFSWELLNQLEKVNMGEGKGILKHLGLSDAPSARKAYAKSLVGYFKARNMDPDNVSKADMKKARDFAFAEALYATFNTNNWLANKLTKFERDADKAGYGTVARMAVESFIPFKRTPLNIMKTGYNYTPVGLATNLARDINLVKKGKMTANQLLNHVAQGLHGTGIVALGWLLSNLGLFRTKDDDKDRKQYYDEDNGEQDYALVFDGATYTIDWLDPIIMPLAMGAEIGKATQNGMSLETGWNVLTSVADPLFETSMLSGISKNLQSYQKGTKEWWGQIGGNIVRNYFSQYVPTIFGATARTIDDTRRSTYTDPTNKNPLNSKFAKQVYNKIPGLSKLNEPYINKQGQEEKNEDFGKGIVGRAVLNFLSPGYYSTRDIDKYDEELYRLYEETGDLNVLPSQTTKDITYDKKPMKFTEKDYTEWHKTRWQFETEYVNQFLDSSTYAGMDADEKVKTIKDIREYAQKVAKKQFLESRGYKYTDNKELAEKDPMLIYDKEMTNVKVATDNGVKLYAYYDYVNNAGTKQAEKVQYLENMDLTQKQREALYDLSGYKTSYQQAYNKASKSGSSKSSKSKSSSSKKSSGGSKKASKNRSGGFTGTSSTKSGKVSTTKNTETKKTSNAGKTQSQNNYFRAYSQTVGSKNVSHGSSGTVVCPNCGNRVVSSSGRCPICGARLS